MSCVMSAISTLRPSQSPGAKVGRHRKPKTQVGKRTWAPSASLYVRENQVHFALAKRMATEFMQ
jgi:hypothetical protein